jgi:aerotaxis receptor
MTTLVIHKPKIRKVTMKHYDGMQRTVTIMNKETLFPKGHLLISHSDVSGNITYVNRLLVPLSGYKESELVGKPHYIFRHPDMPQAVFKELWETLQGGHIWQGPLKNLRKDGGFFWTDMTVTPSTRKGKLIGYVSVYHELSRNEIEEYEEYYPTLC